MSASNERFLQKNTLFRECLEALNVPLISEVESKLIGNRFESRFPITPWGKIDWDKIDRKIEIGCDPHDIFPALEKLFGHSVDPVVYILWSSSRYPVIKADLHDIVERFEDVTCVSFEKFIFNIELGYILEILPSDSMTIGIVP